MTLTNFEELKMWQVAREVTKELYQIVKNSPSFARDFDLRRQIFRSAGSVMDNIAEGFERNGNREFIQFLSIAKGSAGELRSQLFRMYDAGYVDEKTFQALNEKTKSVISMIVKMIQYLKKSSYKGVKFPNKDQKP